MAGVIRFLEDPPVSEFLPWMRFPIAKIFIVYVTIHMLVIEASHSLRLNFVIIWEGNDFLIDSVRMIPVKPSRPLNGDEPLPKSYITSLRPVNDYKFFNVDGMKTQRAKHTFLITLTTE